MWLLNKLTPDYKTIADFRRDNSLALRQVFKQFTLLCRDWDLFSKEIIAVDGSKFRASNSKKSNYSEKKLTRLLKYIEEKTNEYLKTLDTTDHEESCLPKLSATEIKNRIKELKERKTKYEDMRQRIQNSNENELSVVDPDSRLMYSNNNGVDVSYNVQATVDMRHNLVVDVEIINNASDSGQLLPMAKSAKEILGVDKIIILADKGYSQKHTDLIECEKNDITVYAAMQEKCAPAGDSRYSMDNFKYLVETDTYLCPADNELSFWRSRKTGELNYREYANFKACKVCSERNNCTTAKKGRTICRSEAAQTIEAMKKRMKENPKLYKMRQMMNEPVFGTIKRAMGFTYFLVRGFEKVKAEASLFFCAYNLSRMINILGVSEIVRRLQVQ
jgi:hypothetical protein